MELDSRRRLWEEMRWRFLIMFASAGESTCFLVRDERRLSDAPVQKSLLYMRVSVARGTNNVNVVIREVQLLSL